MHESHLPFIWRFYSKLYYYLFCSSYLFRFFFLGITILHNNQLIVQDTCHWERLQDGFIVDAIVICRIFSKKQIFLVTLKHWDSMTWLRLFLSILVFVSFNTVLNFDKNHWNSFVSPSLCRKNFCFCCFKGSLGKR